MDKHKEKERLIQFLQNRMITKAKDGRFSKLQSLNKEIQNIWVQLISLADRPELPILICGQKNTGKKELIQEYFSMCRMFARLQGVEDYKFHYISSELCNSDFLKSLVAELHDKDKRHFFFFDAIEDFPLEHQEKFQQFFESYEGPHQFIFSTHVSLCLCVQQQKFDQKLYQRLSRVQYHWPSLKQRKEDLSLLTRQLLKKKENTTSNLPIWVDNLLLASPRINTFLDLNEFLDEALKYSTYPSKWPLQELKNWLFVDNEKLNSKEKNLIKHRFLVENTLESYGGDRDLSARALGVDTLELSKYMLKSGIR